MILSFHVACTTAVGDGAVHRPVVADANAPVEFDFYQKRLIIVGGTVNGEPCRILVASGTSPVIVSSRLSERLASREPQGSPATGEREGEKRADSMVDVGVAGWVLRNAPARTVDLAGMNEASGANIDLIIGNELFSRAVVRVDFADLKIAVRDPLDCEHEMGSDESFFLDSGGWMMEGVLVNGLGPFRFSVQTGYSDSVAVFASMAAPWGEEGRGLDFVGDASITEVGSEYGVKTIEVARIKICGQSMERVLGVFCPPPGKVSVPPVMGIIGPGAFRGSIVEFDGPHRRITVINPAPAKP